NDIRIGEPMRLLPVGATDGIEARVTEIVPRREFATWRPGRHCRTSLHSSPKASSKPRFFSYLRRGKTWHSFCPQPTIGAPSAGGDIYNLAQSRSGLLEVGCRVSEEQARSPAGGQSMPAAMTDRAIARPLGGLGRC